MVIFRDGKRNICFDCVVLSRTSRAIGSYDRLLASLWSMLSEIDIVIALINCPRVTI